MPLKFEWDRMTPEERKRTIFEQTKNMDKTQRILARNANTEYGGSTNCEAFHFNFCKPPADGNYNKLLVKIFIGIALLGLALGLIATVIGG